MLGSNVANVALVLGISALVAPMTVHWRLLRWEIPVLAGATLATIVFVADGVVERWEGVVMFAGLVAFIVLSPRLFPDAASESADEADEQTRVLPPGWRGRALTGSLLVLGLIALTLGAGQAVRGAVSIAENIGITETAIGTTIVATGTSLPEVATSVVAVFRREHEIAVENVVGSNIFNLRGVVGLTAGLITLEVDQDLFRFEISVLVLSTLVLLPLPHRAARRRAARRALYRVRRHGARSLVKSYARSCSTSRERCSLPVTARGSESRKRYWCGRLYSARC